MQGQFVSHNFLQSFWIPSVIRITPNGKANYLNIGIPIDPADSNVNFGFVVIYLAIIQIKKLAKRLAYSSSPT